MEVHLCTGSSLGVRGSSSPRNSLVSTTPTWCFRSQLKQTFLRKTCCPPPHPLSHYGPPPHPQSFVLWHQGSVLSSKALISVCNYTFISIVSCPPLLPASQFQESEGLYCSPSCFELTLCLVRGCPQYLFFFFLLLLNG